MIINDIKKFPNGCKFDICRKSGSEALVAISRVCSRSTDVKFVNMILDVNESKP